MARLIQCVPNFSEGINKDIVEEIVEEISKVDGVKLLDYSIDRDHNRSVVTFVGEPEAVVEAAFNCTRKAAELIDMSVHKGGHPRMGATDVIPLVPISEVTMEECIELSKVLGRRIGDELGIPVYLYEESASVQERKNLANIRKGEYEGFFEKMKNKEWLPDFGPSTMNKKSGVTAVGARNFLVAFNVELDTNDMGIANAISRKVRHINGGLRYVKAMGVFLEEKNRVQISMNMVNYEKTSLYTVLELIKIEAKRYGVNVVGSEVVGLVPMQALLECAVYYLQLNGFDMDQVLERRIYE
ncbi:MAG: Glutamate formiminotransferase [Firmicutes bacterium]|nr:Glutamate formiminotransferase [Bacillota bacterium]MDI6707184.1 glutamate formimidoyltransferase [Bacillota bacterium]